MITTPPKLFTGNRQLDVNAERMRRAIRTALPVESAGSLLVRTPNGSTQTNIGNRRRNAVVITTQRAGWSGVVVFDSQRGVRVTTIAGTQTDYLRIHVSDASAGLVEYSDGSDLEAWPDGCIVRKISGIVGDLYVG